MNGRHHRPHRGQPRPDRAKFLRQSDTPPGSESWNKPWVQLRTITFNPTVFPAMIRAVSPEAQPGDLVAVYDKEGKRFGTGTFSPRAKVPLRIIAHGDTPVGEEHFTDLIRRAVAWRRDTLQLDAHTEAYRVINSDGDGLSGLIVDRYADTLSVMANGCGVWRRLPAWLPLLHELLGTKRAVIELDEQSSRLEGLKPLPGDTVRTVRVTENGVRYEVDFATGHKTGFFCDQRDNRLKLAGLVAGKRVLDLCCYTGGFAVTAAVLGNPDEVTGVDLDEKAIAQARRNANLNQQSKIRWVHADAFSYARQMTQNNETWDAVVLDPPKFLESREEIHEGRRKYEDLNKLGMLLLKPGGLLVTCSCSGLWTMEDFEREVLIAAHRLNKRLQFFDRTGPGPDHPVMSNAMEGRYLKVLWARVY
jgi:23S rRNA (cytosine1962-C5)-methyltransferase